MAASPSLYWATRIATTIFRNGSARLQSLQSRHVEHQPLRARVRESDFHARALAVAVEVQDHALAELVVPHALAELEAARDAFGRRRGTARHVVRAIGIARIAAI